MNSHRPKSIRRIGKNLDLHNRQLIYSIKKNVDEKQIKNKREIDKKTAQMEYRKVMGEYGLARVQENKQISPEQVKIEGEYGLLRMEGEKIINNTRIDYDVVISITSYNRYKKVVRLIDQFYSQPTRYSFKVILLNDGSSDKKYDTIPEIFNNLTYLKNDVPNGKAKHWINYNQLWSPLKEIGTNCVLQMDDDFILCDDFLNLIMDLYFREKEKDLKFCGIAPHIWSFKKESEFEAWWISKSLIDGIGLLDMKLIKFMKYALQQVDEDEVVKTGVPVRAWSQIRDGVVKYGGFFYRTYYSMVYHDGNNDSKLHKDVKGRGVYTKRFIKNFNDENIIL